MPKKSKSLTLEQIENLLSQQTVVILNAVNKTLENKEKEVLKRIDKLTITIDKFVTLYTKQEQEFEIIKKDIQEIKKVIQEKLGVEL